MVSEAHKGLLQEEDLREDLLGDTLEGKLEGEVVGDGLDEADFAEVEVAIGLEFLQGVVLLLYLLSGPRTSDLSTRPEGSPKAAKICDMFGLSDMVASESELKAMQVWEYRNICGWSPVHVAGLHAGNLSACVGQDDFKWVECER